MTKLRTIHRADVDVFDGKDFLYTAHYVTDDFEFLPETIHGYLKEEIELKWTGLMDEVRKGEKEGTWYKIKIGDFYYETKP